MNIKTVFLSLLLSSAVAITHVKYGQRDVEYRWGRSLARPKDAPVKTQITKDAPGDDANTKEYRNVLYVTNWSIYGAGYTPNRIPSNDITHIIYSFADIAENGTVLSSDSYADVEKQFDGDNVTSSTSTGGPIAFGLVNQFWKLKQANRNLKVLLSIGGYTWSPKFAPVAANTMRRTNFVRSAVQLMVDWGMDGLDIDWEYPNGNETSRDVVTLLRELRTALDDYSVCCADEYHFLLTMASPAGPQHYNNYNFRGMDRYLDSWSLMAFDYAGSWDNTTGHQSNVMPNPENPVATKFSTERPVQDYINAGIRPSKINLGLPLYGRAFNNTAGPGMPYHGLPNGTLEPGIWLFKDLPRPGADVLWDDIAKATYSYDAKACQFVTYDDMTSAMYKVGYLQQNSLGGVMYWEASGDKTGNQSIVTNVAARLNTLERWTNLLSYPQSKYVNIRALSGRGKDG